MTTMSHDNADSVTFSLAELARIEEERVRDEDQRRAKAREKGAREQREAEVQRRAAEEAQLAAQEQARARRQKEEAEEAVRTRAREQAAIEVARIAAEARARLEAENASRAHELALMRVKGEGGRRRLQMALALALGLMTCGGTVGGIVVSSRLSGLEQDNSRLHESQSALAKERDQAKTNDLATLDRRYVELRARPLGPEETRATAEVRATAEAARNAIDAKALDHHRLRSFGEALDALESRIESLEKLAILDRRSADLAVWAEQRKKGELVAVLQGAAARARVTADDASLRSYDRALDQLRDSLGKDAAKGGSGTGTGTGTVTPPSGVQCTGPNDPMCGLNGRPL